MKRDALISECGLYRYWLTRQWDHARPRLLFIMLNPSTADASVDDPTIRKCIGFAERLGYGGITVVNLFAYRATYPKDLVAAGFPEGPQNDQRLIYMLASHPETVLAWGAHGRRVPKRCDSVETLAPMLCKKVRVLRRLADGTPEHPLMLPYSLVA